ncbi:hypothetical protein [Actinomadura nitritigenes]|uniref:hypothetical protein n=1 Tax=Actinomadura nitritigenes TaxID=134602 RepID=UPI003D8C5BA8
MSRVRIDRRVYLTADKSRAVPEGDPDAAFLLCNAGGEIPRDQAERLGLLDTPPGEEEDGRAEGDAGSKAGRRPADKSRRPAANKVPGKPAAKPPVKAESSKDDAKDGGA